ncbi:MAG: hypothetical protein ACKVZ0_10835 [Gemmatimonadales bacterium]
MTRRLVLAGTVGDRGGPAPGFVLDRAPPRFEGSASRVPHARVLHNNRLHPTAAGPERTGCLARRGGLA